MPSSQKSLTCLLAAAWIALTGMIGGLQAAPPARGVSFDGETAFQIDASELNLSGKKITLAAWVQLAPASSERASSDQAASNQKDKEAQPAGKPAGLNQPQVFLNCGAANDMFTFYLYQGQVRMLCGNQPEGYRYALAPPPAPGEWVHYTGSYDGRTIKVYKDGRLQQTVQAEQSLKTPAGPLFIGAQNTGERFLHGRLADIRIWDRALSDDNIAQIAEGGRSAALNDGLVAIWQAAQAEQTEQTAPEQWPAGNNKNLVARRLEKRGLLINQPDSGYRGIWYFNQPSGDEYVYKYSGGLGTYCAKHIPHAWYAPQVNKTFFTYGGTTPDNNQRLIHMVSYFDHKTGQVPRPTILLDKQTSDAHDNPVLNIDDQGYIWIFSSSHGTGRPSYISRSVKPYDVAQFELIWTGNFSYPQPWYIPGHGFLFIHTYYTQGRTNSMMTSPDGSHWSERILLSRIAHGHYQISRPYDNRKVGVAFNYHPQGKGLNWRTNLYYMETEDFGQTWKNIQGKKLEPMLTEVENPALVHDYEAQQRLVYMKDINYDAKGNPIILHLTSNGYESGPENNPRIWTTARWTGSQWDIQGSDITSDNNYDTGSLYIESENLWRIIGPTETGPQPFNPGGEVAMWVSRDQGQHWDKTKVMTRNSPYNHTYIRRPVNAHPDFYGFWADGHGRQPSDSRLYYCDREGDVFRLPVEMDTDMAKPEPVAP